MPTTVNLADTDEGTLKQVGNELLNDSKVEDPAAFRGGAPATQRSLVKFSGDIVENGHRDEVVLRQFKQTENAQNQLEGRGGEETLHVKRKFMGSTDDAMVRVYSATAEAVRFDVPVFAPNLNGSPTDGKVTRFYTDGGKFLINYQDDQDNVRAVIYRVFYKPDGSEDHVEFVGERILWP